MIGTVGAGSAPQYRGAGLFGREFARGKHFCRCSQQKLAPFDVRCNAAILSLSDE